MNPATFCSFHFTDGAAALEQSFPLTCDLTEIPQASIEETGNKQVGKHLRFNVKVEIQVREEVHVSLKSSGKVLASRQIDL